jgi:hypothetical protein
MMKRSSELPRAERADYFRKLASEAQMEADRSDGTIRDAYLMLSKGWQTLADEAERAQTRTADEE